ncbi:hypothetical protein SPRG_12084 [Saprolegnia parasitica CBS 223.65]|uniref:Uncharacterized protein n=1 Tax=Saprolegnia parasitica (strain CBS 223.65) TaxID=695850 RepID=A0A067C5M2_SAPPC|nr:hypothetical protein SPRG_12084 [Saprolegnia parasitica CBS 223.65]KDO22097.1 hypothetical protein SPRG_12084 [Saprolegnia parasitica CBS 223.65]|eukprot:XP_012207239.1 hypothetical protein SPRG_12084 [Saprolegnia parasitica CBS 223.65]
MARCKTRLACKSLDELMEPLHLAQCAKCHRPIHKAHIDRHMQQCNVRHHAPPRASDIQSAATQLASPHEQDASPSFVPNSGETFPVLLPMHELKALAFTPPSRPNLHTTLQVEATRQILFGQTTVAKRKLPKGEKPPTPKRHHVATLPASTPAKPALPRIKPVTLTAQAQSGALSTKPATKPDAKRGQKTSPRPQTTLATIAPAKARLSKKARTVSPKVVRVPPSAPRKAMPPSKAAMPRSVGRVVPPPLLAFPKHVGLLPPTPVGILPRLLSPTMSLTPHKKTPRTTFRPELLHRAYTALPTLLSWSQDDPDMIQMPPSLAASSPPNTPSSRSSDLLLQTLLLQDI